METPVGETFTAKDGNVLKVEINEDCRGCYFCSVPKDSPKDQVTECLDDDFEQTCYFGFREDRQSVIFTQFM